MAARMPLWREKRKKCHLFAEMGRLPPDLSERVFMLDWSRCLDCLRPLGPETGLVIVRGVSRCRSCFASPTPAR